MSAQSYTWNDCSQGITDDFIGEPTPQVEELHNIVPVTTNRSAKTRPGTEKFLQVPNKQNAAIDFMASYEREKNLIFGCDGKIYIDNEDASVNNGNPIEIEPIKLGFTGDVYDKTKTIQTARWGSNLLITDGVNRVRKVYYDTDPDLTTKKYVWRDAGLPNPWPASYLRPGNIIRGTLGGFVCRIGTPGAESTYSPAAYLYYFVLYTKYYANGRLFEDYGPVAIYELNAAPERGIGDLANQAAATIDHIPAVDQTYIGNIDDIKLRVYRTQRGGGIPYFVTDITPSFGDPLNRADNYRGSINRITQVGGEYRDTKTDAELLETDEPPLYTIGATKQNNEPPKSKLVYISRNTGFYARTLDDDDNEDNITVYQSKVGDPDSVPKDLFEQVDEEVVGLSDVDDALLVFCREKIYRIQGLLNDVGSDSYYVSLISNSAGCLSHEGIVKVDKEVYWLGKDAVYHSDGETVQRIAQCTKLINRFNRWKAAWGDNYEGIKAIYDENSHRVYWIHRDTDTQSPAKPPGKPDPITYENRIFLVMDLNYREAGYVSFYTWGGHYKNAKNFFKPKTLISYKDEFLRGEQSNGIILKHDINALGDFDYISSNSIFAGDVKRAVVTRLKSSSINFGMAAINKWIGSLTVSVDSQASVGMDFKIGNDQTQHTIPLAPIHANEQPGFQFKGRPSFFYGDVRFNWAQKTLIQRKLYMPIRRCNYMQLEMETSRRNVLRDNGGSGRRITASNFDFDTQVSNLAVTGSAGDYVIVEPNYYMTLTSLTTPDAIPDYFEGKTMGRAKFKVAYQTSHDVDGNVVPATARIYTDRLLGYELKHVQGVNTYYYPIVGIEVLANQPKRFSYIEHNFPYSQPVEKVKDGNLDIFIFEVAIDMENNPWGWTVDSRSSLNKIHTDLSVDRIPFILPLLINDYQFDDQMNLLDYTFSYDVEGPGGSGKVA